MPAQADGDQGVVVMLQPGRDDGDLQRMIWVAVVREELGIDAELLVDMYFHMAEDVDVIPDKKTIIHLLPDIDQRNQNKGQRDFFLLNTC